MLPSYMWTLILCCYSSSGILLLMVPFLPLLSLYIHTSQLKDNITCITKKKVVALHKCIKGQQPFFFFFLPRLILLVNCDWCKCFCFNHNKPCQEFCCSTDWYFIVFSKEVSRVWIPLLHLSNYQKKKKKKKSKQSIYTCNWKKRLELNPRKNPKVLTLIL